MFKKTVEPQHHFFLRLKEQQKHLEFAISRFNPMHWPMIWENWLLFVPEKTCWIILVSSVRSVVLDKKTAKMFIQTK